MFGPLPDKAPPAKSLDPHTVEFNNWSDADRDMGSMSVLAHAVAARGHRQAPPLKREALGPASNKHLGLVTQGVPCHPRVAGRAGGAKSTLWLPAVISAPDRPWCGGLWGNEQTVCAPWTNVYWCRAPYALDTARTVPLLAPTRGVLPLIKVVPSCDASDWTRGGGEEHSCASPPPAFNAGGRACTLYVMEWPESVCIAWFCRETAL